MTGGISAAIKVLKTLSICYKNGLFQKISVAWAQALGILGHGTHFQFGSFLWFWQTFASFQPFSCQYLSWDQDCWICKIILVTFFENNWTINAINLTCRVRSSYVVWCQQFDNHVRELSEEIYYDDDLASDFAAPRKKISITRWLRSEIASNDPSRTITPVPRIPCTDLNSGFFLLLNCCCKKIYAVWKPVGFLLSCTIYFWFYLGLVWPSSHYSRIKHDSHSVLFQFQYSIPYNLFRTHLYQLIAIFINE